MYFSTQYIPLHVAIPYSMRSLKGEYKHVDNIHSSSPPDAVTAEGQTLEQQGASICRRLPLRRTQRCGGAMLASGNKEVSGQR